MDGHPHVRLEASATTPLEASDILVVLGADEKLDVLGQAIHAGDLA